MTSVRFIGRTNKFNNRMERVFDDHGRGQVGNAIVESRSRDADKVKHYCKFQTICG